jgi:hypothetical protein
MNVNWIRLSSFLKFSNRVNSKTYSYWNWCPEFEPEWTLHFCSCLFFPRRAYRSSLPLYPPRPAPVFQTHAAIAATVAPKVRPLSPIAVAQDRRRAHHHCSRSLSDTRPSSLLAHASHKPLDSATLDSIGGLYDPGLHSTARRSTSCWIRPRRPPPCFCVLSSPLGVISVSNTSIPSEHLLCP